LDPCWLSVVPFYFGWSLLVVGWAVSAFYVCACASAAALCCSLPVLVPWLSLAARDALPPVTPAGPAFLALLPPAETAVGGVLFMRDAALRLCLSPLNAARLVFLHFAGATPRDLVGCASAPPKLLATQQLCKSTSPFLLCSHCAPSFCGVRFAMACIASPLVACFAIALTACAAAVAADAAICLAPWMFVAAYHVLFSLFLGPPVADALFSAVAVDLVLASWSNPTAALASLRHPAAAFGAPYLNPFKGHIISTILPSLQGQLPGSGVGARRGPADPSKNETSAGPSDPVFFFAPFNASRASAWPANTHFVMRQARFSIWAASEMVAARAASSGLGAARRVEASAMVHQVEVCQRSFVSAVAALEAARDAGWSAKAAELELRGDAAPYPGLAAMVEADAVDDAAAAAALQSTMAAAFELVGDAAPFPLYYRAWSANDDDDHGADDDYAEDDEQGEKQSDGNGDTEFVWTQGNAEKLAGAESGKPGASRWELPPLFDFARDRPGFIGAALPSAGVVPFGARHAYALGAVAASAAALPAGLVAAWATWRHRRVRGALFRRPVLG